MKKIKYEYQFSHLAIFTGLLGILINASWNTLIIFDVVVAALLGIELLHNLFMIFGTPLIISEKKLVKNYLFFSKSIVINKTTEFTFSRLFGLSFGKEILTIKTNGSTVKIIDNLKISIRELPNLLLSFEKCVDD